MEAQSKQKSNLDDHQQKLRIAIRLTIGSYLLYVLISGLGLLSIIELNFSFRLSQLLLVLLSFLVFTTIYIQKYNIIPGRFIISLWLPAIISSLLYLPLEGMNMPTSQIPGFLLLVTIVIPVYYSSDYLFIKLNVIRHLNKYSDSRMLRSIVVLFILYLLMVATDITIYAMININYFY